MTLPDSGKRMKYETGAVRDISDGKGRFDLMPAEALIRLAKLYEAGAKKYKPRNWEQGIPLDRFIDSAMRHLVRFMQGDRSEDHLASVMWNIAGYMHTEMRIRSGKLPRTLLGDFAEDPNAIE
jgi:hypothetical protein